MNFRIGLILAAALLSATPRPALAGFTDTLPKHTFLIDESFVRSKTHNAYTNDGNLGPLAENIVRYEPGGGLQGLITVDAGAKYGIVINQLQFGLFDFVTLGLGIPVILENTVDPGLGWEPGDYQAGLGRPYGETDFWEWAASMGQPRPGKWSGNRGVLGDTFVGARYRFSDHAPALAVRHLSAALTVFGSIPTGRPAEPEEPVAAGTTSWNLHFQGEYGLHLAFDKTFPDTLGGRLITGLDLYYEWWKPTTYETPTGSDHPLILTQSPYVGSTYSLDPGDFSGAATQIECVVWKGAPRATWLSGRDTGRAEKFPPVLALGARYTFTHLQQSDWSSQSAIWDWDREKIWRPGYKNILNGTATLSLLRLGVPMQIYFVYRNMTWLPGKNARAVDAITIGTRIPLKFW